MTKISADTPLTLYSRDNNNVVPPIVPISDTASSNSPSTTLAANDGNQTSVTTPSPLSSTSSEKMRSYAGIETPIIFPTFANIVSVENDASQAKLACSAGHSCKRTIDKLVASSKLSQEAVNSFISLLISQLTKLLQKVERLKELTKAHEKTMLAIEHYELFCRKAFAKLSSEKVNVASSNDSPQFEMTEWKSELQGKTKQLFSEIAPAVTQLYQKYVKDGLLKGEWDSSTRQLLCPWRTKASQRASTLVDRFVAHDLLYKILKYIYTLYIIR